LVYGYSRLAVYSASEIAPLMVRLQPSA
jgi:hypothetical protein